MSPTLARAPHQSNVDGQAVPSDHGGGRLRPLVVALRLTLGLLMLVSLTVQIGDEMINGAFTPGEYFSYFTTQSSLINAVVLLLGGLLLLGPANRQRLACGELFTRVRMAALAYAVVTGIVYAALLRGAPSHGFVGIPWPPEVLHVWAPALVAADWLLSPGRARLGWVQVRFAMVFPIAWLVFTVVHGALTSWFPYPFLDPAGSAGPGGVWLNAGGISLFIVVIASIAIGLSRIPRRPLLRTPTFFRLSP